jgi:hypothetical protein
MKFIKTQFTFSHKGLTIHLTVRDESLPHRCRMEIFDPKTGHSMRETWIAPHWRVVSIGGAKNVIETALKELKLY